MERLEVESTATGLTHTQEEEFTNIYDNYEFRHEYNPKLSITQYRQEV